MLDKLIERQSEIFKRLEHLEQMEGHEDNPEREEEVRKLQNELINIDEQIKTELF